MSLAVRLREWLSIHPPNVSRSRFRVRWGDMVGGSHPTRKSGIFDQFFDFSPHYFCDFRILRPKSRLVNVFRNPTLRLYESFSPVSVILFLLYLVLFWSGHSVFHFLSFSFTVFLFLWISLRAFRNIEKGLGGT